MRVVITGGAGFLGQRLANRILALGKLVDSAGEERDVTRLVLNDIAEPVGGLPEDERLEFLAGDFGDPKNLERLITPDTAVVFHLAAVVSGGAEEDFELGLQVNLHATECLLESLRALESCPRIVFASSVAAYGGDLPEVIKDDTPLTPQTSYGCQKAITEFLINDYSRRGFLDGRALRLPTIVVRPGKPNQAATSFASAIIREPLQGDTCICPVPPETGVWVLSSQQVVKSFIHAERLAARTWGYHRAVALPGLTTTVSEMVEALESIGGPAAVSRIEWKPDADVQKIVRTWPVRFQPTRALGMGFQSDVSIVDCIKGFVRDELGGQVASQIQ
ncbi:MAG: NAD-dependent epimerase/dehydratase family protein [Verrucomicrobiaceae bacterium]|nr:NAD-dependent epimerase/dehydratase family protein [Verrucomicrobiaceae bacterium]